MQDDEFRQLVESSFAFLQEEHAFSQPNVILHGPTEHGFSRYIRVIYSHESGKSVEVGAACWRCEFDVAIAIGAFPNRKRSASLRDLLAVVAPNYAHPLPVSLGTAPSDPERMAQQVDACADALREFGGRFFVADLNLWAELESHQEQQHQAVIEQIEIESALRANDTMRSDALAAFRQGDWTLVVSLYESITEPLARVEQKRLSIAKKRSG